MLNNIGLPGILLLLVIFGVPLWLTLRSSKRKAAQQARIAEALEKIAQSKSDGSETR
ncbi:MAG: hypothetical protein ACX93P_03135 [Roseovarius sp.]|nr:hypothetical protein [Roseovarius sp.]